jgi:sterol desaturase/sphingolipid hydroxylase (fatty acid hydroxylase superfamily)
MSQSSPFNFQPAWQAVVEAYSPQALELGGTLIIQLVTFWVPCALYQSLDVLFPAFSHRHKIQPAPKQPNAPELWYCFYIVLRNQLLSTALHVGLIAGLTVLGQSSSYRITTSLPGPLEVVRDLAICILLREIIFYYSHRLLHMPRFYAPIHKFHHRFVAPIAMAAEFAHPFEHLVSNILPVSMPPQLIGAHIVTAWLFIAFVLLETVTVHSGYDFAGNMVAMHDLHHELFMINFGTVGFLDRFHGTYKKKEPKGEKKQ